MTANLLQKDVTPCEMERNIRVCKIVQLNFYTFETVKVCLQWKHKAIPNIQVFIYALSSNFLPEHLTLDTSETRINRNMRQWAKESCLTQVKR